MSEASGEGDRDVVGQPDSDQCAGQPRFLAGEEHEAGQRNADDDRTGADARSSTDSRPTPARGSWGGPLLAVLVLVLTILLVTATR